MTGQKNPVKGIHNICTSAQEAQLDGTKDIMP